MALTSSHAATLRLCLLLTLSLCHAEAKAKSHVTYVTVQTCYNDRGERITCPFNKLALFISLGVIGGVILIMLATWAIIVLLKRRAKRRAQRIYAQVAGTSDDISEVTAYDPPSAQDHSFANPEWEKPAREPDVESYYKAPELGYEYKPTYIPPVYKPAVLESARNSFEVIPPAIPAPPTVQGHLYPPPVTS